MKVIGIYSSPARNGNTAVLVREALQGAAARGAEVEEISLAEHNLSFCQGCSQCMVVGRCPLRDSFEVLREKVYSADGVILGSPTYSGEPNAIMKNFFDRLGLYTAFTSSLAGKYVAGISTDSSTGASAVAKKLTSVVTGTFGAMFARGYVSGTLAIHRHGARVEDVPGALEKARRIGDRVADDILHHRTYPLQNLWSRVLSALFMRRSFEGTIKRFRQREMKAVYASLVSRGLISPADEVDAGAARQPAGG
jgi:multimeric flavodoxin WrbA